ncbi:N-acetyl-gamma-glutamyl-phosphate reductase [compost metagenome]
MQLMPLQQQGPAAALDPEALNDSNDLRLALYANPEHGQVLLTAVFDNLGKGASGAAVQNLELMLAALHAQG